MGKWPNLQFPTPALRLRTTGSHTEVWHAGRGQWLVLTPEEWVRRHVVGWLEGSGIEPQRIIEEYPIPLNGQSQRADVVVVDCQGAPRLLVECKAAEVKLSQATLDQAVRYNSILRAEYVMLTNGQKSHLYHFDGERYRPYSSLPTNL